MRGGLIDVFASTGREPIRIELFGDQVERVSAFSLFTQRSLRDLGRIELYPAAEQSDRPAGWGQADEPEIPAGMVALTEELVARAGVVAWNPDALVAEVEEAEQEVADRLRDDQVRARGYVPADRVATMIESCAALEEMPLGQPVSFDAQPPGTGLGGNRRGRERAARAWCAPATACWCASRIPVRPSARGWRFAGWRPSAPGEGGPFTEPACGSCSRTSGTGSSPRRCGWRCCRRCSCSGAGCPRRRPASAGRSPTVSDLRAGDYVVHEDHGVGRFVRFDTKEVGGVVRDYLYLEFKGEDRLYVPARPAGQGQPLRRLRRPRPALSKLGGKAWQTLKTRARVAVRELAGELLALYARRQHVTKAADRVRERVDGAAGGGLPVRGDRRPAHAPSTSCSRSSSPTGRWTGWCAGTSASARPRSPCGPRSRWPPPAARC